MSSDLLKNYYNGGWQSANGEEQLDVLNPATQEVLGRVPLSGADSVAKAVEGAQVALRGWRQTPGQTRRRRVCENPHW